MIWTEDTDKARELSHCLGYGRWADEAAWRALGVERVRLLRQYAGDSPITRVVDYGCGGGSTCLELLRQGCQVIAVDVAADNLAACQLACLDSKRLWALLGDDLDDGVHLGVSVECDAAVCTSVIQHLDSRQLARELMRSIRSLVVDGAIALIQTRHSGTGAFEASCLHTQEEARADLLATGWRWEAVTRQGHWDYWHVRAA